VILSLPPSSSPLPSPSRCTVLVTERLAFSAANAAATLYADCFVSGEQWAYTTDGASASPTPPQHQRQRHRRRALPRSRAQRWPGSDCRRDASLRSISDKGETRRKPIRVKYSSPRAPPSPRLLFLSTKHRTPMFVVVREGAAKRSKWSNVVVRLLVESVRQISNRSRTGYGTRRARGSHACRDKLLRFCKARSVSATSRGRFLPVPERRSNRAPRIAALLCDVYGGCDAKCRGILYFGDTLCSPRGRNLPRQVRLSMPRDVFTRRALAQTSTLFMRRKAKS